MNQHNYLRNLRVGTLLVLLIFFLTGCASTDESTGEPECRPQTTEECVNDEDAEDRGYDPCLVNKNLPVCKS